MEKENKGFSLVELIIVIAIMAVLIGLLAPQYMRFVTKSRVVADVENANALAKAINTTIAESHGGITLNISNVSGGTTISSVNGVDALPISKVDESFTWTVDYDNVVGVKTIKLNNFEIYPGNAYYNKYSN